MPVAPLRACLGAMVVHTPDRLATSPRKLRLPATSRRWGSYALGGASFPAPSLIRSLCPRCAPPIPAGRVGSNRFVSSTNSLSRLRTFGITAGAEKDGSRIVRIARSANEVETRLLHHGHIPMRSGMGHGVASARMVLVYICAVEVAMLAVERKPIVRSPYEPANP
jgi:hypothetical protein